MKSRKDQVKLICLILFMGGFLAVLLTNNRAIRTAQAYSAGPPPGHTGAPGETTCTNCHSSSGQQNTGQFTITAPQTYVPGQTYQITVTHATNDTTRKQWGFELTALTADNAKAGNLQSLNTTTNILSNGGPGGNRQYIEHTSLGTFFGQARGASWTFNWIAPASNLGPITFYAAGNQANGDGDNTGDQIYTARVTVQPTSTALPTVQLSAPTFQASEGAGSAVITVTRTGDTSGAVLVDYATVDDPAAVPCNDTTTTTAYARCDYSTTVDTLLIPAGQTQKTFTIPLINDAYVENPENVQLRLSNPVGATLGAPTTAALTIQDNDTTQSANPIDTTSFFVRMQYLDFLSREPEPDGFAAWTGVLNRCSDVNNNPDCDRAAVSSSFFRSEEFQLKGYFVYRFYKVSLGRLPHYDEIIRDMRSITGQTGEEVDRKKIVFTNAWVERADFKAIHDRYPDHEGYVDNLISMAGITFDDPTTRDTLIENLTREYENRAQVLRDILESQEVKSKEYNGAFVAMQYYGYLRREPEQAGYDAWLRYLNNNPTDYRTMVNGFMNSTEYRLRFGQP